MKTDYFDLHRKEKVFVFSVIIAWTILAVTTLARAEDSSTNRMLPVTLFGTNTVLVNVPADKEALIRKYLLLAQSYQEQNFEKPSGIRLYFTHEVPQGSTRSNGILARKRM